ncbi:hypothetical protein Pdw03_2587 [Penicillium digitatum]|uniref:Uncharacterized protein n=1 Tax=Penicillium digitatum TaxID=36651 RepID=A0A7T6XEN1_PENDI|nr:hypothetical protein Pdw03_2587 [Penicillium digitatum]
MHSPSVVVTKGKLVFFPRYEVSYTTFSQYHRYRISNIPKAWKRWWGCLNKLSDSTATSTTQPRDFIKNPSLEPTIFTLAAADLTTTDVNGIFGLGFWTLAQQDYEANYASQSRPKLVRDAKQMPSSSPSMTVSRLTDFWTMTQRSLSDSKPHSNGAQSPTFIRLNNEGKWSLVLYQVSRDGWAAIANVIAYRVLQGYRTAASPLRSSASTNRFARQSSLSSKAPRIFSTTISEAIDEKSDFFSAAG